MSFVNPTHPNKLLVHRESSRNIEVGTDDRHIRSVTINCIECQHYASGPRVVLLSVLLLCGPVKISC